MNTEDKIIKQCIECKKPILGFGKTGLCRSCCHKGSRAYNYKGDEAGYFSIHNWIYSQLGKASYCSNDATHKSARYEWSSISRKSLRDINDFRSLCLSCHRKYDITDEVRIKMSQTKIGTKCSEDTKAKMKKSATLRWAKERSLNVSR